LAELFVRVNPKRCNFAVIEPINAVVQRQETCNLSTVQRVAALLDLDFEAIKEGEPLPRGWQFILMAAATRKSQLRSDGFPGLGLTLPDLGFSRLLLGGRSVTYIKDILIGARLNRVSHIQNITEKTTPAGPMAVATVSHALHLENDNEPALIEKQTYLLLPQREENQAQPDRKANNTNEALDCSHPKVVVPDETMLFQYSALGFNSHKIHLDRDHARNVEGFPNLVVNGGLATLLLTEHLRHELGVKVKFSTLKVRHILPLFCGEPITLCAIKEGSAWRLKAYDNHMNIAIEIEASTDEL
jgi:3-methylfumaryl-CoA hydratase